jgi:hypothetical protein
MATTVEEARKAIVVFLRQNPTMPFSAVAAHFGCGNNTIGRIAKAAGIPAPPRVSRIGAFKEGR